MAIRQRLSLVGALALVLLAAPGAGSGTDPNDQDRQYLQRAHQDHLAEIAIGMAAQRRGNHAIIRDLGTRFVSDHTKIDESLRKTAGTHKVSLPETPTAEQQAFLRQLESTSGAAFDQLFISTRLEAHQGALTLSETEQAKGSEAEVKKLATDTATMERAHQQALNDASRQISGPAQIDSGSGGLAAPAPRTRLGLAFLAAALALAAAAVVFRIRRRPAR